MIYTYSYGAAEEVTGSKHFLEVDGKLIQIDCGAFQGKREESDEKNRKLPIDPSKVDHIILTHGHYDHSGLLPFFVKNGFKNKIYSTSATLDLTNLVISDSAKIQAADQKYYTKKHKEFHNDKPGIEPLYTDKDCTETLNHMISVPYYKKKKLEENISFQLFDAGHILGSSLVEITIDKKPSFFQKLFNRDNHEKLRILYTGDIGRPVKPIIKSPDYMFDPPDYIFLESTYGNRIHQSTDCALREFAEIINDTYTRGGKIMIPSFAIERTQELLFHINKLMSKKLIPKMPVFVDSPMASHATDIFKIHPECYSKELIDDFINKKKNPFSFHQLKLIATMEDSKKINRIKEPCIIIAADGMCENGRICHHLAKNIEDPNNTVLIVGFMAENTLGRKILEGEKEVKIHDEMKIVGAEVRKLNAFSAHADYSEMLDWLKKVNTSYLKKIFLVHGEPESQAFFKKELEKNGYNVDIIKEGKKYKLS